MNLRVAQPYANLEQLGSAADYVDEILDIIEFVPIFQGLDREEIKTIAAYMACFGAPAGETLLREGELGDHLLLLLTGEVQVLKRDEHGFNNKIAQVRPGTTVGEMSLIDGQPRFATCITKIPSDFAVLGRQHFNRLLSANPLVCVKFTVLLLQMMTRRLRDTSNRMLHSGAELLV